MNWKYLFAELLVIAGVYAATDVLFDKVIRRTKAGEFLGKSVFVSGVTVLAAMVSIFYIQAINPAFVEHQLKQTYQGSVISVDAFTKLDSGFMADSGIIVSYGSDSSQSVKNGKPGRSPSSIDENPVDSQSAKPISQAMIDYISGNHPNDYLQQLTKGKIGSDIPDTMQVGNAVTATVRISQSDKITVLLKDVTKEKITSYHIEDVRLSHITKVTLFDPSGENFKCVPLSSNTQLLQNNEASEWKWSITPQKKGKKNELVLKVSAIIENKNARDSIDIPVYAKSVFVTTTYIADIEGFFERNWQFLVGLLLVPVFTYGRNRYIKWRNETRPRPSMGFQLRPREDSRENTLPKPRE